MKCGLCDVSAIPVCTFTAIFSRFEGRWLFSRHKSRATWETQGGHVEPGETPFECARRELYEESGARAGSLTPVCGYYTEQGGERRYGIVYLAELDALGPLPESEMAETRLFDALPDNLTYPAITPILFAEVQGHAFPTPASAVFPAPRGSRGIRHPAS